MRRDNGLDTGGRFVDGAITPQYRRQSAAPTESWWLVPAEQFGEAAKAQLPRLLQVTAAMVYQEPRAHADQA